MAISAGSVHSRRTVLAAAAGGVAATLSMLAGRAMPASGAEDEFLRLGEDNVSDGATSITRVTSGPALVANGTGPGMGCAAASDSGIAMYGIAESGHGVVGSSVTGSGVEAISPRGIALRVRRGRIRADGISGVARIARRESRVVVQPAVVIAPDAFVLLTPMSNLSGRDLWFTRDIEAGTFDINISPPADGDTRVAWLLMG